MESEQDHVSKQMNIDELKSYNAALLACEGEYKRLKKLYEASHSWEVVWENVRATTAVDRDAAWKKLDDSGIELIALTDTRIPSLLREIPWPPFALYVRGTIENLENAIAIVGTRKATPQGIAFAGSCAGELSRAGCTVVSGLAFGIDTAAHQGTLKNGGKTVAVLANGLDTIYPRTNTKLAKEIIENGGALVSEYPLGSPPLPRRFLERNRVVSGLSRGTVVIEAPTRSGSLATARFAIEQNRDVFVAPGPVIHPNYAGSHELIKSGATLITSSNDIVEELDLTLQAPSQSTQAQTYSREQRAILKLLEKNTQEIKIDTIAEQIDIDVKQINQAMSTLVIEGVVKEVNGAYTISHLYTP